MTSLEKLCKKHKITCVYEYGGVDLTKGWPSDSHPWLVTLKFGDRQLTVPFFQGSAHTSEPTPADVLSCLCSDAFAALQTFEDWAESLGYDTDSRRAEQIYKQCVATYPKLKKFLGEHFEDFVNAEY